MLLHFSALLRGCSHSIHGPSTVLLSFFSAIRRTTSQCDLETLSID